MPMVKFYHDHTSFSLLLYLFYVLDCCKVAKLVSTLIKEHNDTLVTVTTASDEQ